MSRWCSRPREQAYAELRPLVRSDVLAAVPSGALALHHDFTETTRRDVWQAEMGILPVVPVLLLLAFGSVMAAALPFGVGLLAGAGGLAGTGLLPVSAQSRSMPATS